ncbi:hypothetical protein CEW91_10380 [Idiomarina piscisalsi]|uniref:Uncharacterized protein n=1 Tax=Idiomarina piscisalsi TaxID=1096243 RepID=A0ABN5AWN2_9GAMM|nr:hypothetical protein CEW91_06770 [Idiomarina piscisalsi]ASG66517.1 hypothetical protein CEW91_10380 [Idiomarina piscisalsi]
MEHLHLDIYDSNHEELCRLYWEVTDEGKFLLKVSEVAKMFGVKQSDITKIVKSSCVTYSPKTLCCVCKKPRKFASRSEYQASKPNLSWECSYCSVERELSLDEKKRELLGRSLKTALLNPLNTDEIGFMSATFFLALVRYSANENLTEISPLSVRQKGLLSPQFDFDIKIVKHLYREGVIAISPLSPLDALELNEDGGLEFYLDQVAWEVPLKDDDSLSKVITRIEKKFEEMEYIDSEYESVKEICQELCLLECLEYLDHVIEEHYLSFKVGEKTKLVLNSALEKFSVAQVYNFIWRAAKDAAAFYLRSGVTRIHAANTIVGNIQKQYERALANGWDVKAFSRNYNMPQSIISQVVFNLALKTDDGGFNQQIDKII